MCREALPEVWEWLESPLRGLGRIRMSSWRGGRCQVAH